MTGGWRLCQRNTFGPMSKAGVWMGVLAAWLQMAPLAEIPPQPLSHGLVGNSPQGVPVPDPASQASSAFNTVCLQLVQSGDLPPHFSSVLSRYIDQSRMPPIFIVFLQSSFQWQTTTGFNINNLMSTINRIGVSFRNSQKCFLPSFANLCLLFLSYFSIPVTVLSSL